MVPPTKKVTHENLITAINGRSLIEKDVRVTTDHETELKRNLHKKFSCMIISQYMVCKSFSNAVLHIM